MASASFPTEARKLAALEVQLSVELASLEDLQKIEQEIVENTTEKTAGIAEGLLNRLEDQRSALVSKKIVQLEKNKDPIAKVGQLKALWNFMTPEKIDEQLSAIALNASLLPKKDAKTQRVVQEEFEHLNFMHQKPIVHELDENVPHSFAEQVSKIAETVRNTHSLQALRELNPVQLGEIGRVAGRVK
ncbi:MAG: hypothetical protein HY861_00785 [Chlamydiia bacterium]|nr:hypothetical protein [Chlamydiia bacterium]